MSNRIPIINKHKTVVAWSLVSPEDYETLSAYSWSLHPRGYVQAYIGKGQKVLLHRMVMGLPLPTGGRGSGCFKTQVDHINGDKLDNRRENLRAISNSQNHQNRQTVQGSSKYRGVYYNKSFQKFCARVKVDQKYHWLGSFENEFDAAIAAYEGRKKLMPYCVEERPVQ